MSTTVTEPACLVVVVKRIGRLPRRFNPQTGTIEMLGLEYLRETYRTTGEIPSYRKPDIACIRSEIECPTSCDGRRENKHEKGSPGVLDDGVWIRGLFQSVLFSG
jgi:hypothetical protein